MRHQHQRHAGLGAQREQQLDDRRRIRAVEVAGRLVRQAAAPAGWRGCGRSRRAGARRRTARTADALKRPPSPTCSSSIGRALPARPAPQARCRSSRSRRSRSRSASAAAGTPGRRCRSCCAAACVHARRSLHLAALPQHAAAGRPVEPRHDVDEAALAAAARTDDRHELAARDRHVDAGERHDRAVVEDPADIVERDQRRRSSLPMRHSPPSLPDRS